jgi:hypothetical protein
VLEASRLIRACRALCLCAGLYSYNWAAPFCTTLFNVHAVFSSLDQVVWNLTSTLSTTAGTLISGSPSGTFALATPTSSNLVAYLLKVASFQDGEYRFTATRQQAVLSNLTVYCYDASATPTNAPTVNFLRNVLAQTAITVPYSCYQISLMLTYGSGTTAQVRLNNTGNLYPAASGVPISPPIAMPGITATANFEVRHASASHASDGHKLRPCADGLSGDVLCPACSLVGLQSRRQVHSEHQAPE